MSQHHGPSIPTMPLVRPPVPRVLAVTGTLPSPAPDAGSHGLEMPPRHHDPLRAVAAPNTSRAVSAWIRLASCPTNLGGSKTPYDQKHLCHPGDTLRYNTLCALRWELHALVGHTEQRAPTSRLTSLCGEERRAQRGGDIAIFRRHPEGVRGASIVPGVRDDTFQEVPRPPASTYCVTTNAKKLSDSTKE